MPRFTVEHDERTFVDAHGVTVHFYVWKAARQTAVVQLLHGVGEHALRYEPLAQDLVDAGYTVYADDHRGHGQTGLGQHGGDHGKLGTLGPGGVRAMVSGIRQLSGIIREENPDIPLVLLGHSLGSLLAQLIVNDGAADYDALVLSGTALRTLRGMNGGDLSKRHAAEARAAGLEPTGTEWLSRDPAVSAAFVTDELTFPGLVSKLFGVREALRLLGRPKKPSKDLPVLMQVGSDDTLGGPKSVEALAAAYRKHGLSDVEVKVYPDARHEVYNEINRGEVIADLVAWLNAHLRYTPPSRRR